MSSTKLEQNAQIAVKSYRRAIDDIKYRMERSASGLPRPRQHEWERQLGDYKDTLRGSAQQIYEYLPQILPQESDQSNELDLYPSMKSIMQELAFKVDNRMQVALDNGTKWEADPKNEISLWSREVDEEVIEAMRQVQKLFNPDYQG